MEYIRSLQVFAHRNLRSIGRISWNNRISKIDVRHKVLGKYGKTVDGVMNLRRLRWSGHVLRVPDHYLPHSAMLAGVEIGWKKGRGSQTKTWHQPTKSLTFGLNHGGCRLPESGQRDNCDQWLERLGDMAQNRPQWRKCIHPILFHIVNSIIL